MVQVCNYVFSTDTRQVSMVKKTNLSALQTRRHCIFGGLDVPGDLQTVGVLDDVSARVNRNRKLTFSRSLVVNNLCCNLQMILFCHICIKTLRCKLQTALGSFKSALCLFIKIFCAKYCKCDLGRP